MKVFVYQTAPKRCRPGRRCRRSRATGTKTVGVVVIARSRKAAEDLIEQTPVCDPYPVEDHDHSRYCYASLTFEDGKRAEPVAVFELRSKNVTPQVFLFPDAGCC